MTATSIGPQFYESMSSKGGDFTHPQNWCGHPSMGSPAWNWRYISYLLSSCKDVLKPSKRLIFSAYLLLFSVCLCLSMKWILFHFCPVVRLSFQRVLDLGVNVQTRSLCFGSYVRGYGSLSIRILFQAKKEGKHLKPQHQNTDTHTRSGASRTSIMQHRHKQYLPSLLALLFVGGPVISDT